MSYNTSGLAAANKGVFQAFMKAENRVGSFIHKVKHTLGIFHTEIE